MSEGGRPAGTRDGGSPFPPPATTTAATERTAEEATERTAGEAAERTAEEATERTAQAAAPADPRTRRSRRPLLVGLAIGVLVLAGGTAAALAGGVGGLPRPAPTPQVVVLPSPTPTIAPVARAPLSPFADSLADGVLRFALTGLVEHRPMLLEGALESYRLDYSDGGTGTLTVLAGQWPTAAEAATAYAEAVAAAGAPTSDGEPTTGDVLVGGAVVGAWTVTTPGDGLGTVTWSNGTAVLQLTGPADVVRDAYAAYPY